jgi:hypothetical protein
MTEIEWPELVPFEVDPRGELPPFPTASLPPKLAAYAESVAAHFLAPVDLPGVLMLGTVSGSIAGRVRLEIEPHWSEPANLYLLAVLSPSLHKSPVLKIATAPVEREECDLAERWRSAERETEAKREVVKHHIATIKRRKASAETDAALRERLAELETLAPTPRPRLMIDDSTSEHVVRALEAGPLFIASAEGRVFELMSGLYRRPGEDGADVYLKAWSEDPIRSGRVTSGDVYVPLPNLTLTLAVQPAVVDKLSRREDFRGRGLIARFLCSFPRTRVGWRRWNEAAALNVSARLQYDHVVSELLTIARPPAGVPAPLVRLDAEAHSLFSAYRQELEEEQRQGRLLGEWQDLGGKLAGHCARIAIVLHMAECGSAGLGLEMTPTTVERAVTVTRYFVAHTIATWDGCASEPIGSRVVRWLARCGRESITTRDLHRAHQKLFRRAQEARSLAIELVERGYLRPDEPDTWLVSPRLRCADGTPGDRGDSDRSPDRSARNRGTSPVTAGDGTGDDTGDSDHGDEDVIRRHPVSPANEVTVDGAGISADHPADGTLSPLSLGGEEGCRTSLRSA